jgi:SET domain-containing protein
MSSNSDLASRSRKFLFLQQASGKGQGVFTRRHYEPGETILCFKGNIVGPDQVEDHGKYLQVGKRAFLGASGDIDDFVNHSCEPNCGVALRQGKILLISIREIQPKEELTFDYSTWMAYDYWEMDCICGNTHCRKKIKDFKYLPRELKQKYMDLNVVPDYVLRENQFQVKY